MSKLLFDEYPLIVSRKLAKLIGLNEAVVLQQIHYWLEINRKANKNFHDGRYWTYNSMKNWHEKDFSFWSFDTVKRTFASLVKRGFLVIGNYNKLKFDQTKWYSIDYKALETLNLPISANCTNGEGQFALMEKGNLPQPIPENNAETRTAENILSNPIISVLESSVEKIENDKIKTDEIREEGIVAQEGISAEGQKKGGFPNAQAAQSDGQFKKPTKPKYEYNILMELIKDNIEYESIITENPTSGEMLDEVCHVITSTILSDYKDGYVSMGNERANAEVVRSVFLKLTKDDIDYFFECFNRQTEPITKITAYIRTCLYRNHRTINHHIANRVNTDFPQYAEPKIQGKRKR